MKANLSILSVLFTLAASAVTQVPVPTIVPKAYTGARQTADVPASPRYEVVVNDGGTGAGTYEVWLELTDAVNTRWEGTDDSVVCVDFGITRAENAWTTAPSMTGWTYGETAKVPSLGQAKFGTVRYFYEGDAYDGTHVANASSVTKAGEYAAVFAVAGTANYTGLTNRVPFTVARAGIGGGGSGGSAAVSANGYTGVYDGRPHGVEVSVTGSDAPTFTVTYAQSPEGPFSATAPTFTSVTNATVWFCTSSPFYNVATNTLSVSIAKAPLTVTARDATAIYGDAPMNAGVTYSGFVNDETASVLEGTLAYSYGGYAEGSSVGSYAITPSGLTSGNYAISFRQGTLTILPEPVVKKLVARQRYPWNGLIDIDYELDGLAEGYDCRLRFFATNTADQTGFAVASVSAPGAEEVDGGLLVSNPVGRVTWMGTNDLPKGFRTEGLSLTVKAKAVKRVLGAEGLEYVQLWENGPYWATCNVGASKPEESGYYFWWGDTVGYKRNAADDRWISGKDSSFILFNDDFCPTECMSDDRLKSSGYVDASSHLVAKYDAATAHWGASWRMPTVEEFAMLIDNCDSRWTTQNGTPGRIFRGRGAFVSNSIFLPAAGVGDGWNLVSPGVVGVYWSSSSADSVSPSTHPAWSFLFDSSDPCRHTDSRYYGFPVRPLRESAQ